MVKKIAASISNYFLGSSVTFANLVYNHLIYHFILDCHQLLGHESFDTQPHALVEESPMADHVTVLHRAREGEGAAMTIFPP